MGVARIIFDFESLYDLYEKDNTSRELLRHGLAAETAGADGIAFSAYRTPDSTRKKTLENLRDNLGVDLTVFSDIDNDSIESCLDLKPSMAVLKYDNDKMQNLSAVITKLQVGEILGGIEIPLELDNVKSAAKLKADYLVLDCQSYCNAESFNLEVDELNNIVKIASLGSKLSLGIIASGEFDTRKLRRLNDTGAVEEFIMGKRVISESLLNGYRTAFNNIRTSLS